jgi:hypothetical protein
VPEIDLLPAVSGPATLLANGKLLFAGGISSSGDTMLTLAWLFDPDSGTWTPTVEMISGRSGNTATLLLDGRVLVAGGVNGSSVLSSAELYDPGSGTE